MSIPSGSVRVWVRPIINNNQQLANWVNGQSQSTNNQSTNTTNQPTINNNQQQQQQLLTIVNNCQSTGQLANNNCLRLGQYTIVRHNVNWPGHNNTNIH